jgi:hypothetical protein
MSHWDLVRRILESGRSLSPIFQVPWMRKDIFRVDWLRVADLGVAADFLGSLFFALLESGALPGASQKERCVALWREVQAFYEARGVQDKLQSLSLGMISKRGASPKLRASAAQVRALVPFGKEIAERTLSDEPLPQAMKAAARNLCGCYDALSSLNTREDMAACSRRFASQVVELERLSPPKRWRVKPKLHLFLELAAEGTSPSLCWTYRDEDFGGTCSRLSRRRGGLLKAHATSTTLLQRFLIKQPPLRLR